MPTFDRFVDEPVALPLVTWPKGLVTKLCADLKADNEENLRDDLEFILATHVDGLSYDAEQPKLSALDDELFKLWQAIDNRIESLRSRATASPAGDPRT